MSKLDEAPVLGDESGADIRVGWHRVTGPNLLMRAVSRLVRYRRESLGLDAADAATMAAAELEDWQALEGGELRERAVPRIAAIEQILELPNAQLLSLLARVKDRNPAVTDAVQPLAMCPDVPGPERDAAYAAMLRALGAA